MKNVLTCLAVLGMCGCLREGTVRTDLSKWELYKVPDIGIQIERPVAAHDLSLHFHSSGTISDGAYRVLIEVEKHTPAAFADIAKISPKNALSRDANFVGWLNWVGTFHDEISERPINERQKEYRRDVNTKDSIITIHVTYSFVEFSPEEQAIDEAAIKRILLSAKPIEEEPQQPSRGDVAPRATPEK